MMDAIVCPSCGSLCGSPRSGTVLVWGKCPECGTKFTSMGGLNAVVGWEKVGCWEPPKSNQEKANGFVDAWEGETEIEGISNLIIYDEEMYRNYDAKYIEDLLKHGAKIVVVKRMRFF